MQWGAVIPIYYEAAEGTFWNFCDVASHATLVVKDQQHLGEEWQKRKGMCNLDNRILRRLFSGCPPARVVKNS